MLANALLRNGTVGIPDHLTKGDMMHSSKTDRAVGAISKVCNTVFYSIVLLIILIVGGLLVGQLLGYKPLAILSGSMEPSYQTHGLLIVDTNVAPEQIEVGDVIAFQLGPETTVTHRVTSIDGQAQLFTTRGDANNMEDLSPVPFDKLIGRAGLYLPLIGYPLMNLHTTTGLAVGLISLAVLIALFVVPQLLAPSRRGREVPTTDKRRFRVAALTAAPQGGKEIEQ
jgi:signal peptidase